MDNELYHYGILGMKWGIRRYQNKDGTLTSAGKKRYGVSETSPDKKGEHDVKKNTSKEAISKYELGVEKVSKDPKNIKELRSDVDHVMEAARIKDKQFSEDAFNVWRHDSFRKMLEYEFHNNEKGYFDEVYKFLDSLTDDAAYSDAVTEIDWYADTNLNSDKYEELMYPYMEYLKAHSPKETVHVIRMSDTSSDELYHYGILGMKWGIRRYQNKDGTLTAAGRKRYEKAQEMLDELNGAKARSDEKARQNMTPRQRVKEMTDEELMKETARLRNEKNYLDAVAAMTPSKRKTAGDVLKDAAIKEIEKLPGKMVEEGMKALKKYMDDKNNEPKKLKEAAFKAEVSLMSDEALEKALQRAKNEKAYTNIKLNKADKKN